MDRKIYHHLPLQDLPKFTQIWIFGLNTNHLATLISGQDSILENKFIARHHHLSQEYEYIEQWRYKSNLVLENMAGILFPPDMYICICFEKYPY
jgi:hypothetical protein